MQHRSPENANRSSDDFPILDDLYDDMARPTGHGARARSDAVYFGLSPRGRARGDGSSRRVRRHVVRSGNKASSGRHPPRRPAGLLLPVPSVSGIHVLVSAPALSLELADG